MSPKSTHYQEAKSNLEENIFTTTRFIVQETRAEAGESGEREKRGKDERKKMKRH